ncbi:cap protein [Lemur associated porprismacovirus 1]|uniref:Cap protein n=1 Tax=Lemur associated porprismacovirus 1 TaxID=2170115 RepID=A0A0B5GNA3_9VIRU|nr:cap protein [Lemur associated porprismacovirus 1]AJF23091.1 cap protein [Lemur associated porprismacovirus 1]
MRVQISETYDLSTKINKMGIVGIHTPVGPLLNRLYPGLVLNYKKFRFSKCDITLACASMLPADPLQVGVEAGAIAPQDMFNPILFKAVSNDTMNQFVNYIQYYGASNKTLALDGSSVVAVNDAVFKAGSTQATDQFSLYYSLLADPKGWRKAMPQSGLQMRNLRPLVFQVVENGAPLQGRVGVADPATGDINSGAFIGDPASGQSYTGESWGVPSDASGTAVLSSNKGVNIYRGRAIRMPWISTKFFNNGTGVADSNTIMPSFAQIVEGTNVSTNTGRVPPTYVACIIVPPAKLNVLYYRMKVTWTVEFTGLSSMTPYLGWNDLTDTADIAYGTDYANQASVAMTSLETMVDTSEVDMSKIMEG